MPKVPRHLIGSLFIHVMTQGINREYIFKNSKDKECYLNMIKKMYQKNNVKIIAYCIMDNHAHMLLYTEDIKNLSKFFQEINRNYAIYYNKKYNRVGYVFRGRFKSKPIYSENLLLKCIKYIHMNPVKAHITEKESYYEFSSYNDYINQTNFINQEILNLVFRESKKYLKTFLSIEYQKLNLEENEMTFEEIIQDYLKLNKILIDDVRKNSIEIQKLIAYIISQGYKFSKLELCNKLNISRAKLYRNFDKKTRQSQPGPTVSERSL